jgi:hypothetical protein
LVKVQTYYSAFIIFRTGETGSTGVGSTVPLNVSVTSPPDEFDLTVMYF